MHGVIKNYRRGRHTVNERQLVIEAEGVSTRAKAFSLVGSRVEWKNLTGKIFTGKIVSAHGGNGAVRALFRKGMPGQCLSGKVEITAKGQPKPAAKKPAEKKPSAEKPAVKKPAEKKPVAKKPAAGKPVQEKPAAKK